MVSKILLFEKKKPSMQWLLPFFRIFGRYLWHMIGIMTMLVMSVLVVKFFILSTGQVNGMSMENTFFDNDMFVVNKLTYFMHAPERYDIVQVIDPAHDMILLKRIIGLPGEVVIIKQGKVFVQHTIISSEEELPEPYVPEYAYTRVEGQQDAVKVPLAPYTYFIMGDNREFSTDSRVYGGVHRSRIIGKVIGRL